MRCEDDERPGIGKERKGMERSSKAPKAAKRWAEGNDPTREIWRGRAGVEEKGLGRHRMEPEGPRRKPDSGNDPKVFHARGGG